MIGHDYHDLQRYTRIPLIYIWITTWMGMIDIDIFGYTRIGIFSPGWA